MSVVLLLCPTVLLLCATVLLLCARFEELLSATSDRSMLSFSALASPSLVLELVVELTSDLARLLMAGPPPFLRRIYFFRETRANLAGGRQAFSFSTPRGAAEGRREVLIGLAPPGRGGRCSWRGRRRSSFRLLRGTDSPWKSRRSCRPVRAFARDPACRREERHVRFAAEHCSRRRPEASLRLGSSGSRCRQESCRERAVPRPRRRRRGRGRCLLERRPGAHPVRGSLGSCLPA